MQFVWVLCFSRCAVTNSYMGKSKALGLPSSLSCCNGVTHSFQAMAIEGACPVGFAYVPVCAILYLVPPSPAHRCPEPQEGGLLL